jgi:hypothetical protein
MTKSEAPIRRTPSLLRFSCSVVILLFCGYQLVVEPARMHGFHGFNMWLWAGIAALLTWNEIRMWWEQRQ